MPKRSEDIRRRRPVVFVGAPRYPKNGLSDAEREFVRALVREAIRKWSQS